MERLRQVVHSKNKRQNILFLHISFIYSVYYHISARKQMPLKKIVKIQTGVKQRNIELVLTFTFYNVSMYYKIVFSPKLKYLK